MSFTLANFQIYTYLPTASDGKSTKNNIDKYRKNLKLFSENDVVYL